MFTKYLTNEQEDKMVFRHDTCNFIAEACRDIRDRLLDQTR